MLVHEAESANDLAELLKQRDQLVDALGKINHRIIELHAQGRGKSVSMADDDWSEQKNERRCELIDKQIQDGIDPAEACELEVLQQQFHRYIDEVAPPPIEGARRLHAQLLRRTRNGGMGG